MSTEIVKTATMKLLNGPFAVLVIACFMVWGGSNFSDAQVKTLGAIMTALDNPPGYLVFGLFVFFFMYALLLAPIGSFIYKVSQDINKSQTVHYREALEHIEGSKSVFHKLSNLQDSIDKLPDTVKHYMNEAILPTLERIDEFYHGKSGK